MAQIFCVYGHHHTRLRPPLQVLSTNFVQRGSDEHICELTHEQEVSLLGLIDLLSVSNAVSLHWGHIW